jgi:hypothetical protein
VYAFVPGKHPHPVTDPRGHSFGQPHIEPERLDPENPSKCHEYLFAIDLFNAGYYWEAHEAWEGLWVAASRAGTLGDFLKGLIKLAAAGVKSREGLPVGVQRHARRAAELFRSVQAQCPEASDQFAGLLIDELIQFSDSLAAKPIVDTTRSTGGLAALGFRLILVP